MYSLLLVGEAAPIERGGGAGGRSGPRNAMNRPRRREESNVAIRRVSSALVSPLCVQIYRKHNRGGREEGGGRVVAFPVKLISRERENDPEDPLYTAIHPSSSS